MQFHVRALDARQQIRDLDIEALDEADARKQTASHGLTALSVAAVRKLAVRHRSFSLMLFAQELHALIVAGLSVIEALDALTEKDSSAETRAILARLAADLREGTRLSDAFRQQPAFFPPLFVGVVQAAEGTSDLPRALGRYIDYESRLLAIRHKVFSATIYPAVLMVVGGAVSLFLLGYVVPRFAAVYEGSRRPLPWASQLLLDWGRFAGEHAAGVIIGFGLVAVATLWWIRRELRSGGIGRLLAWLPAARTRLRLFEFSRLYLTLGMLLEGGIPIVTALGLSGAVLMPSSRPALETVRQRIEQGNPFSEALSGAGLSTPIAQRLLRVGEKSGQLGAMLTRAAQFYEGETTRWIDRFTKVFEPALMAAIGLVVGLIVILLYMPIFELAGSLQ